MIQGADNQQTVHRLPSAIGRQKATLNRHFFLAGLMIPASFQAIFAQLSEITVRFANPAYDCISKTYCLDVEMMSNSAADTLYGTNARFFYNSTVITFTGIQNIETGYRVALTPTVEVGQASSGNTMFNFEAGDSAAWLSGAVELQNQTAGKLIGQGSWTKFYEVCFTLTGSPSELNNFCPELILDLQKNTNDGFLPASDGLVITAKSGTSSRDTDEQSVNYNWSYYGPGTAPYGDYAA